MRRRRLPDELRCEGCPHLEEREGGRACALRGLPIAAPRVTFCANHPAAGDRRIRVPVGPILSRAADGVQVVAPSPDSTDIRTELIVHVDESDARRVEDLTLREEVALWQLVQWRERRSFVVQDKVDGEPELPGARGNVAIADGGEVDRSHRTGRFVSGRRRTRTVVVLFVLVVLSSLALAVVAQARIDVLDRAAFGEVTREEAESVDAAYMWVNGIGALLRLVLVVAFLMWVHRASANAWAMSRSRPRYSPAMAVLVWFIPFVNLVLPYHVVREIATRSSGPEHRPMGSLVLLWWLAFVAMLLATRFSGMTDPPVDAVDRLVRASRIDQAVSIASIVSAVLAIQVVLRIERRQASRPDIPAVFE